MTTDNDDDTDWHLKLMEVQRSLNSSESRVTKCKPFSVIYKYLVESLINNPVATEIDKINKTNNKSKDTGPAEILQRNKQREEKRISKRATSPIKF